MATGAVIFIGEVVVDGTPGMFLKVDPDGKLTQDIGGGSSGGGSSSTLDMGQRMTVDGFYDGGERA